MEGRFFKKGMVKKGSIEGNEENEKDGEDKLGENGLERTREKYGKNKKTGKVEEKHGGFGD